MINQSEFLSVTDAAEYVGVSPATLRRWDETGKLRSLRNPGNNYRYYSRADLEPFRLEFQQAQRSEPGGFFTNAKASIEANPLLREPQREAHRLAREHFRSATTPAVLQIPVGCGKTGVIATLPFGIAAGRVLVLVPNTTIRDGVAEQLDITNVKCFFRRAKVLGDLTQGPYRAVLDGPNANIDDCARSHFVVANIQQLASRADRWLPQFPDGFFDMILVDEGHHNAADSWKKVFGRFPNAKVISLTATPFRSDGQALHGEVIYRYSYSSAMLKGYIKQLHALNVAPQEIWFTYRGDEQRHSLEEVLKLREEAWFRRGVALAPECNRHIVEASIRRCLMLREATGTRHQIIAAACSIDHARQIRALYEQRGFNAREIHSNMPDDEQESVFTELRSGRVDCVVQVQMLGEGFDHPPLSVAAIFRPYRSLSPYIQFVGRIMRVLQEEKPEHPDNRGYIVSHVGLNNDANWTDFRDIDLEDQEFFHQWLTQQGDKSSERPGTGGSGGGHPRRFDTGMQVAGEFISHFIAQSYLDPNDDRVLDTILNQKVPGTPFTIGSFTTREQLRDLLVSQQNAAPIQVPEELPVQPQDERRSLRKRLDERSRSVANRVLHDLKLSMAGRDVSRAIPEAAGKKNREALYILMHRAVNEFLGIKPGTRNDPEIEPLRDAYDQLDALGDQVRDAVRASILSKAD